MNRKIPSYILFLIIVSSIIFFLTYTEKNKLFVDTKGLKIYTIDFLDEWRLIQKSVNINNKAFIENLEFSFNQKKEIIRYKYKILEYKGKKKYRSISIRYEYKTRKYEIKKNEEKEYTRIYLNKNSANAVFNTLSKINIIELFPKRYYSEYVFRYLGYSKFEFESFVSDKYMLFNNGNIIKLNKNFFPYKAFGINTFVMESTSTNTWESRENKLFLLDKLIE